MNKYPEHDKFVVVYYEDYPIPQIAKFWILDGWATFVSADSDFSKYIFYNGDTLDFQPLSGTVVRWSYLPDNWNNFD